MRAIIGIFAKIPPFWRVLWVFCLFSSYAFDIFTFKQFLGVPYPRGLLLVQSTVSASVFYYVFHHHARRWFWLLLIIYFLAAWLYLPQALMYGNISFGIIASLWETNPAEAWEYLMDFPPRVYALFAAYWVLFAVVCAQARTTVRRAFLPAPFVGRGRWAVLAGVLLLNFAKPVYHITVKQSEALTTLAGRSYFYPSKFFFSALHNICLYRMERDLLNRAFGEKPTWQIVRHQSKYQNHVLIIGESMRGDYLSLYGYPFDTTPFLKQTNGLFFQNHIAAAPNTQASLNRTLYRTDAAGNIVYPDNIVSLAKQAGIKTYWLSNQGFRGEHDAAAARLAVHTDYFFFTKQLDYAISNRFDSELLPRLADVLSDKTTAPRLIVLHLMGSHPDFCQRLEAPLTVALINPKMSCYLQSLMQTDEFIRRTDALLRDKGEPYSIIYFSDHGLSSKSGAEGMWVSSEYKQSYRVPLLRLDGDRTERVRVDVSTSAFDFINGFAEWLGIEEKTLSAQPPFFAPRQGGKIRVFNGQTLVDFDTLADDPPLPPTPITQ